MLDTSFGRSNVGFWVVVIIFEFCRSLKEEMLLFGFVFVL